MGHTGNICLDWQLEARFDTLEISNGETSLHRLSGKTGKVRKVRRRGSTLCKGASRVHGIGDEPVET